MRYGTRSIVSSAKTYRLVGWGDRLISTSPVGMESSSTALGSSEAEAEIWGDGGIVLRGFEIGEGRGLHPCGQTSR